EPQHRRPDLVAERLGRLLVGRHDLGGEELGARLEAEVTRLVGEAEDPVDDLLHRPGLHERAGALPLRDDPGGDTPLEGAPHGHAGAAQAHGGAAPAGSRPTAIALASWSRSWR